MRAATKKHSIESDPVDTQLEAYDQLPAPVWISTEGEASRWFNKAWLVLTGRGDAAAYLDDWKNDIEPEGAVSGEAPAKEGPSETAPRRVAYRIRAKNGSYVRVEEVSAPRFSRNGVRLGYLGICHETAAPNEGVGAAASDRRDGHDASLITTLIDGILHHAVFLMDAEGNVVTWNRGAESLNGRSAAEILGKNYATLFTAEDRAAGLPVAILSQAAAQGHFEAEGWRVRKDGRRLWAQFALDCVRDFEGRLVGFTNVSSDMTRQHEALANLEEARGRLFQAQKMEAIGQLTGGVAHDFNNLLTVILGAASTLRQELAAIPALRELADITVQAADRGEALTNQLLAFARRQPLEPEATDVNKCIFSMRALLDRSLGELVEVEFIRGAGLWSAMADRSRLEGAILNLCLNARGAMANGGKVTIETANVYLDALYASRHVEVEAGRYVMVAVSDTGCGMPPHIVDRAFEPFFTTKRPDQGNGLGLSIVHGFVKQSGGHVKIYSEVGYGTTVKIYLPRADSDAMESPSQHAPAPVFGVIRVLVVEDNELVRVHATGEFHSLGFEVESVGSAREALTKLSQREDFGLLFTDVAMPGMDGRQLACAARALRPDLPILFTSGHPDSAGPRSDKGVHLLAKPYRREDLVEKLAEALGIRTSGG